MNYTAFQSSQPTTAGSPTPTRQETIDAIRNNLMALRDALVACGSVQGFDYSQSGGTAEEPGAMLFTRGSEIVKITLTWGTTGGEDGNVTKAVYEYSSNGGSSYDPMVDAAGEYVLSITYDSNGNCTATAWGATP